MDKGSSRHEPLGFGGFVGLEPIAGPFPLPHAGATLLTSGRACLAYILDQERPKRVHVPFYSCDELLRPILDRRIPITYYPIGADLLPLDPTAAGEVELTVLVDLFGVRTGAIDALARQMGPSAVIDSTHAYFAPPPPSTHYAFNSVRKFRGVPDGGFMYAPHAIRTPTRSNDAVDRVHLDLRNVRADEVTRQAFRTNEERQSTEFIGASAATIELLQGYDHEEARAKRAANFRAAHAELGGHNAIDLDAALGDAPMCYPLLPKRPLPLARVHELGIFAGRYWPELRERQAELDHTWERSLADDLIAFPIDQRYEVDTVTRYVRSLRALL